MVLLKMLRSHNPMHSHNPTHRQHAVNGAAGAVDNNQEIDAAANVQAESGTPAPDAAQIQAQAVDAAAPVVDAEEDLSTRYQMDTVEKAIGHKALIEQKKATDTTNVFSRIMSVLGIFGFIGIACCWNDDAAAFCDVHFVDTGWQSDFRMAQ